MIICDLEKYLEMREKVLFTKFLSYQERVVLLMLIHYCTSGTNICRMSISNMMEYAGITNRSRVIKIFEHLEEHKYIRAIKDGNKTNRYEILDIDEAEEYAIKCIEEKKELKKINEKLDSPENKTVDEVYSECSAEDIEQSEVKEDYDSNETETSNLVISKGKDNKSSITVSCNNISKLMVVTDNNEGADINLTLYSSDKVSTTVCKIDKFNIEIVPLE